MADLKISALTPLATLQDADLFVVVDDSEVSAVKNKSLTWAALKAMISAELGSNFALADLSNTNLGDESAGDLLYYTGSAWDNLPKGTPGYFLKSTAGGLEWAEVVGGGGGISHATSDGNYYASKDGDWAQFEPGILDADSDGTAYGRKDGAWAEVLEDVNDGNGTQWNGFEKSVDLGAALKIETVLGGKRLNIGNKRIDFGSGFDDYVALGHGIAIDDVGNMYVAGAFSSYKGVGVDTLVKILPDGSRDEDFSSNVVNSGFSNEVYIMPNGKLLLNHRYWGVAPGGIIDFGLTIVNTDGTRDSSVYFGIRDGAADANIKAIPLSSGKIFVVGKMDTFSVNVEDISIGTCILINADGTLDTTFNTNVGTAIPYATWNGKLHELADGKIVIIGDHASWDGDTDYGYITILNADGTLYTDFVAGDKWAGSRARWVEQQSDGKLIIGGDFTVYDGVTVNRIMRLDLSGDLDATFQSGTGFNGAITCIKVLADDRLLIGGAQSSYNGDATGKLTMHDPDGALYKDFRVFTGRTAGNSNIFCIAVNSWGKIVIGGEFTRLEIKDDAGTTITNITANRIASLMPNGLPDSADFDVERTDVFAEVVLHEKARLLEEPDLYDDLDLIPLKKVSELIYANSKRVQATVTDGDTPELDCDSGTEVYFTWEGSNSTPDVNIVNSVVNSVFQISYRKVTAGNVTIKLAGDDLKFVLEGNATPAATLDIVLSGAENSYWSINGAVTGHTNGYDTDKVVTVTYKQ